VGDPIYAHHNGCFRVFNMLRELQAHRYELGPRAPIEGEDWSTLLTQLGNDVTAPPAPDAGVSDDASATPIADGGAD
jgi:hypothetical protein